MLYIHYLVRTYPLSCCLAAGIWVLCLMPVPETPLSHVTLADKWAHMSMYAVMCLLAWTEYLRGHTVLRKKRLFIGAWLAPVLMSGLIEIAQATCTGGRRSGDWLDFAANAAGATLGLLIGIVLTQWLGWPPRKP